jgi:murein DD-endopeptidase MepM/ murein hydrolase activator NlpD
MLGLLIRMNHSRFITFLILACLLFSKPAIGSAQDQQPEEPIYIVQEGDSLWDIAIRFGVSIDSLTRINDINDASQLSVGDNLIIPGLEGIKGYLNTVEANFGDSILSLSRKYQIPIQNLLELNHLTSSYELYAGRTIVVLEQNINSENSIRGVISNNQSLFEYAIANDSNPWEYIVENQLEESLGIIPGDVIHLKIEDSNELENPNKKANEPGAFPGMVAEILLEPVTAIQGKTEVIKVIGDDDLEIKGKLLDNELNFFVDPKGDYVSIQGIHAMVEPGSYPLDIEISVPDKTYTAQNKKTIFNFSQPIYIKSGGYAFDPVLVVSPETIDPTVTRPEDAQWSALGAPSSPEKYWEGKFLSPVPKDYEDCWPSLFGNRRSYNGSAYDYFHTGLDFCGGIGTEIYAPASGKVVFAGPLTVRGNATVIDHGWGVYTAYMHQSEIFVKPGEWVEPGQLIGLVGDTGRVTGPHLHWEVWAGGIQVDPMEWLVKSFPDAN